MTNRFGRDSVLWHRDWDRLSFCAAWILRTDQVQSLHCLTDDICIPKSLFAWSEMHATACSWSFLSNFDWASNWATLFLIYIQVWFHLLQVLADSLQLSSSFIEKNREVIVGVPRITLKIIRCPPKKAACCSFFTKLRELLPCSSLQKAVSGVFFNPPPPFSVDVICECPPALNPSLRILLLPFTERPKSWPP